jgi:hypothetical protein
MTRTEALADECARQEENCLYTGVSFTIWLRGIRIFRAFCLIAPVILGALATWQFVVKTLPGFGVVCAFLAGIIPTIYAASKTDGAIEQYTQQVGEYTNLRDRFRYVRTVSALKGDDVFEAETTPLFDRLERIRAAALTPPEFIFKRAQQKVKGGDYKHDYDQNREQGRG